MSGPATAALPRPVALQLAHAVVADVAAECAVPVLFVKGHSTDLLGIRPPWLFSDIDILMPRSSASALAQGLQVRGWRMRAQDADTLAFPRHATALFHPSWPCDIDLHVRFPGFDHPDDDVFSTLWDARIITEVADRTIAIPPRTDAIILLALHALRAPAGPRREAGLDRAHGLVRPEDVDDLLARATALGARSCARPFLSAYAPAETQWGEPPLTWQLRDLSPAARRMSAFLLSPRDRARIARAALLPGRSTLFKDTVSEPRPAQVPAALIRRLWRGTTRAPGAFAEAVRFLRENRRRP